MAAVLKLKFQGEVRRIALPEGELSFEVINNGIRQAYPESTVTAKYLDEENDLCTLCPGSFSDFVEVSSENNGKKILKLELFVQQGSGAVGSSMPAQQETTNVGGNTECAQQMAAMIEGLMKGKVDGEHPMAAMMKGFMNGSTDSENPMPEMINMAMKTFKAFTQQGGFGARGCHGFHGAKKLGFAILQLRKNGELNDNSAAALCAYCLPRVVALAAERPEKINWIVKTHMPNLRPVLEDLRTLAASTQGLEESEARIVSLLEGGDVSASEVLLSFLCALDALPFEALIAFFKALYTKQEHRLQELFAKMDHHMAWVPKIPLEHPGVTCDGCEKKNMKGLRFKCKDCPDYDLCSECFCKKGSIHCGECSPHEFELVHPVCSWPGAKGMGKCMGKGMGKCMGKGMGKGMGKCGKGKGKHHHSEVGSQGVKDELRACSREGCGFAATWHPTHCCAGCHARGKHGPRCEQRLMTAAVPKEEAATAPQEHHDELNADGEQGPQCEQQTTAAAVPAVAAPTRAIVCEQAKSEAYTFAFHECELKWNPQRRNYCDNPGCPDSRHGQGTVLRCAAGCDIDVCQACMDKEIEACKAATVQEKSMAEDDQPMDVGQLADFTYPVEVEDGRRLTLAWNKADDLEQVAKRFVLQHRIPSDEQPTITSFLEHVTTMRGSTSEGNEATPTTGSKEEKEAVDEALDQSRMQLEAMGFDFGNPEVLLELLKNNDGSVQKVIDILMADAK